MSQVVVTPLSLSSATAKRVQDVQRSYQKPGALSGVASDAVRRMHQEQTLEEAFVTLHQVQRLYLVATLGLQDEAKIHDIFTDPEKFPLWNKFIAIETTDENKKGLAQAMYSGDPQQRTPALLTAADYTREIAEEIVALSLAEKKEIDVWIDDPVFQRRVYTLNDVDIAKKYGELMAMRREGMGRTITFNLNTPSFAYLDPKPAKEIVAAYNAAMAARKKAHSADIPFMATRLPTQKMAELDQMPYDQYTTLFFNTVKADPKRCGAINECLVELLDPAEIIEVFNIDGTRLKGSNKGFTWNDSRMARNVPGYEVHSVFEKYSAEGRIVAMGRFVPPSKSSVIENISLTLHQGKIIDYSADVGQDILADVLNTDEGSRYLGEFAFGTNYALQQHVCNSMLVEKIFGSYHCAIGRSYKDKEYFGKPINIDNGNESKIHWDIATMLFGKEGRILVDGKPIMEKGVYLDKRLKY